MLRLCLLAVAAVTLIGTQISVANNNLVVGKYVEVRTCDVWTGPCFANAEGNLTGKNAVMVWQIDNGTFEGIRLDGLSILAVIQATDTLGAKQSGPSNAMVLVDSTATPAQRSALIKLAQLQSGDLLANIANVRATKIDVNVCNCEGNGCAVVEADGVKIKTRCIDERHDKHCGNETAYYPPLICGTDCVAAVAEHSYRGDGLDATWQESERRGAYVGTFSVR